VAQLDPIWANFSISENQLLSSREQVAKGLLEPPEGSDYVIEVQFADGSIHPHKGRVNFAEPNVDPETGTMLVRAELANPESSMRPGQFVRVLMHGASRPNAITVPQTAVMQGAKGHFVWVLDKESKAQVRAVEVGSWHGDSWFINKGLQAGDQVVIDNLLKMSQGVQVKNTPPPAKQPEADAEQPSEKTE
jgi:membrane fusion protein (multidrug efflux system)